MTDQDPLWVDPHWTTAYTVGDRVRNTYTNAAGTVTRVVVDGTCWSSGRRRAGACTSPAITASSGW